VSRVASVGQLTTALAHEVNQPLTAILRNAEAAQRPLSHGTADTTVLQEILHDIAEDDVRAGEIIRRIRGLVRKDEPERRPVDIAAAIREVVELVRNDASLQHVTVVSAIDPSCPAVFGDRVQLQQVLLNLMLNALDAMRAESEGNREILVTAARDEQLARVVVRDRGTGIDAEKVEDIFLPFVTTKPDGLGVGLSICRTIIQDHGGRLWAENNPDGGATFQFTLPCFEGAPAPGSATKPDTMSEAPLVS